MPQLVDILKNLHALDVLLVLIIIGFAFLGFTRGAVKLFIIMVGIYVGFVVASIYYLPVGTLIQTTFSLKLARVGEIIAFFLLNVVVSILLVVLLFQFFGHLEVRGRMGACIDRPVGMLLGFLTGILLTAILVILLEVPYQFNQDLQLGSDAPFLKVFNEWYNTSNLAQLFVDRKDLLLNSVAPLLGGHIPLILQKPASTGLIPTGIAVLLGRLG